MYIQPKYEQYTFLKVFWNGSSFISSSNLYKWACMCKLGTLDMQLHKYRADIGTKDEKHHKKLPSVLPVFVLGVKKTKGDMMTPYGKRVRSIVHWPMNMLSHAQWGEILLKGAFLFLCNCVFTRYLLFRHSVFLP